MLASAFLVLLTEHFPTTSAPTTEFEKSFLHTAPQGLQNPEFLPKSLPNCAHHGSKEPPQTRFLHLQDEVLHPGRPKTSSKGQKES